MMQLKDIKVLFHKELDTIYGRDEVASFFFMLIDAYFNIPRYTLALEPDLLINSEERDKIFKALNRLKKEEPIQYILGDTEFYGLTFKVNKHTLIPRPETEELVDWVVKKYRSKSLKESKSLTFLDIGTGSGCIAISLAKHIPNSKVYAIDVSKEALAMAKKNAKLNEVNITFIEASILDVNTLSNEFRALKFDLIISNPPYVRNLEKTKMKPNVLDNEPHLALFVENETPLIFYKAITQFAVNNLARNGALFFEINEYLGAEMIALLNANNFQLIELKKDLFGKDRMLQGVKL